MKRYVLLFIWILMVGTIPAHGQLQLPEVFSDHMVLQREEPFPVWGSGAEPGKTVTVELGDRSSQTTADSTGAWKVTFPAMSAGGPFELKITSGTDNVVFDDVLIGEVWVASGQSNMAWPLNQSEQFDRVKSDLNHPDIRLFKMEQGMSLGSSPFMEEELQQLVQGSFYQPASWKRSTLSVAAEFSALAYYFARNLQDSLNVPVDRKSTRLNSS